jgi:hypothetical protein
LPRLVLLAVCLLLACPLAAFAEGESSRGYVEMPESPEGDWVLTNRPGSGANWGTPAFVRYLIMVAQEWRRRHPDGPRLRIGDMSKPDGSDFPPHKTHKDGLTADIFTSPRNVCHVNYPDQELTLELARLMHDLGARQILYNGQKVVDRVPVAKKWPKHDDHFHVVIDPSRVPEEGALLVLPRSDRKDGGWVGSADLEDDGTGLELAWEVIGNTRAKSVQVEVDDLDDANGVLYDSGPLRSKQPTHRVPLALGHGQSYRWRVRLDLGEDQEPMGVAWQTLRVDLLAPQVASTSPDDEAELAAPPLLRWRFDKPGVPQGGYRIELDKDRSHRKIWKTLGPYTGSASQHALSDAPLKKGKRYYWRVVVIDARGNEAGTEWRSFRTAHTYDRDATPGAGAPAGGDAEAPASTHTGRVKASALNMRSGPGTHNPVVSTLKQGTELQILGESNGWLQVQAPDGKQGWVSGSYVEQR